MEIADFTLKRTKDGNEEMRLEMFFERMKDIKFRVAKVDIVVVF